MRMKLLEVTQRCAIRLAATRRAGFQAYGRNRKLTNSCSEVEANQLIQAIAAAIMRIFVTISGLGTMICTQSNCVRHFV